MWAKYRRALGALRYGLPLKQVAPRPFDLAVCKHRAVAQQHSHYREHVLRTHCQGAVSVEAGAVLGWDHSAGGSGAQIGMRTFGSPAPFAGLVTRSGFAPDVARQAVRWQLARNGR